MFRKYSEESNRRKPVITYTGEPVDIWCIGVTLHILLRGDYPFRGLKAGLDRWKDGTLSSSMMDKLDRSVQVSPECRDFVAQCLAFDAAARPTVEQLMAHAWMQGAVTPAVRARRLHCSPRVLHAALWHALTASLSRREQAPGVAVGDPAVLAVVNNVVAILKEDAERAAAAARRA